MESWIKQDNILWRLFRIFVEETEVPNDVSDNLKEKVEDMANESK